MVCSHYSFNGINDVTIVTFLYIFAAGGLGISVNCHGGDGGIVWRFFVALTNGNNFAFTERFEEL